MSAMRDATGRLLRVTARDRARLFAVVSEAVWWVTIVDATLVRYHPDTYDGLLTGRPPADRQMIEETLAGLRFVRNRMGQYLDPADFILPAGRPGGSDRRIRASMWKSLPEPELGSLPSPRQAWEMTRYRAYEAQLAGHRVGETFELAAAFLKLAAADATPAADVASAAR